MKLAKYLFILAVIVSANFALAKTHIITFGGSLGDTYSPASLNVSVGDTIIWQGDFGFHPLSSTHTPSGAPSFSNMSGSTFSYVVTKAGDYAYQCDVHVTLGMTGAFSAVVSGVPLGTSSIGELQQNMPNPVRANVNHETMIHFMLDKPEHVTLSLFDSKGALVATILNDEESEGRHMVTLDVMPFASGTYTYVLSTAKGLLSKSLIVLQ